MVRPKLKSRSQFERCVVIVVSHAANPSAILFAELSKIKRVYCSDKTHDMNNTVGVVSARAVSKSYTINWRNMALPPLKQGICADDDDYQRSRRYTPRKP